MLISDAPYLGDFRLGETVPFRLPTMVNQTPTDVAGATLAAYPNTSDVEITAGFTIDPNFDGRTGFFGVDIAATGGNGYATGTTYCVLFTAGTLGGVALTPTVLFYFSIEARSALMPTVAARTLDVTAAGEAGIDWANIGAPTTAQNLSGTNIDADQVVASVTGAVGSVTGNVGGNVTGNVVGSVGSVIGNVGGNVVGNVDGNLGGDVQGNVDGSIGTLAAAAQAQVLAQALAALATAVAEPAGVPTAPASTAAMVARLYQVLFAGLTVNSATNKLQFKNSAGVVIWEKDLTDDGTEYTESIGNAP